MLQEIQFNQKCAQSLPLTVWSFTKKEKKQKGDHKNWTYQLFPIVLAWFAWAYNLKISSNIRFTY